MKLRNAIIFWICLSWLAACAPDLETRTNTFRTIGGDRFKESILRTENFDLFVFLGERTGDTTLTVLIEGDGYSWKSRRQPSDDPTPLTPVLYSLSASLPIGNTVYLARPCQFVGPKSRNCNHKVWTRDIFTSGIVSTMDEALSVLKAQYNATQLKLIGYSGGGVIAAVLAAQRSDVASLVTIAAPLDIDAFTSHHHTQSFPDRSLNPKDYADQLYDVPQLHLFGELDSIVPKSVADAFLEGLQASPCVEARVVAGADHMTGWGMMSPPLGEIVTECKGANE